MQVQPRPNVLLVGTAHVSTKSVEEVREAIASFDPDVVAVELDENRLKALTDKQRFEDTPVTEFLKGGKSFFVLAQTMLASFQRRMGSKEGVEPGAEMLAAVEEARDRGKEIALADRDIGVTLKRAWAMMGFVEKWKLSWEIMKSVLGASDEEEIEVDEMLEEDVLTVMMDELAETAPSVSKVLVKERDVYLAKRIDEAAEGGRKVVAIVGAGHMRGIEQYLKAPETLPADLTAIEEIPEKRVKWGKIIFYGFLAFVLGLIAWLGWSAYQSGDVGQLVEKGVQIAVIWILVGGVLTAIGAAIGGGHPLAILVSFPAAPIGTVHPALAAGWISGYVEAKLRPPTLRDMESISSLETFRDIRRNGFMRILLVTAFANVGNTIANLVIMPIVIARLALGG